MASFFGEETRTINGWTVIVEPSNGGSIWGIYRDRRAWDYGDTPEDCNMDRQFKDEAWAEATERAEGRGPKT